MPKGIKGFQKSDDGDVISLGSEAWNVADGYTKLKILKQLVLLDNYEIISQFGTEKMDEDLLIDENMITKRRIEAINRFVATLKQLLGNVKFALKKPAHTRIEFYLKRIALVEEYLPHVSYNYENMVTHELDFKIHEGLFKDCLEIMQKIKAEINVPINQAGLIFKETEEVDIDKIMNNIIEGG